MAFAPAPAFQPRPALQGPMSMGFTPPVGPMSGALMNMPPAVDYTFHGYERYGDPRAFLMQRHADAIAAHQGRILATQRSLDLWKSKESAIYGEARKRDDETRFKSSKPFRIVELFQGLVMAKEPRLQVAACKNTPMYTKTSGELESDLIAIFNGWKLWRGWYRAIFWSVVGGVGPIEYYYDDMAMDDEPLMKCNAIDPRTCVWKESKAQDGSLSYIFTAKDEMLGDIAERFGLEKLDTATQMRAAQRPMDRIKVYTYWAVERMRVNGKPQRVVVSAVFTDAVFLRSPEMMVGYSHIPVVLVRGSDYPLEHEDNAVAYMSALEPVREELIEEMRMLSALMTNAKYHTNPATNLFSNRADIKKRVNPARGGANHLYPDERAEEMRKASANTPDVQNIMQQIGESIEGTTVPKQFQGNLDLKDISGISLSVGSTGPLLRLAKRQQLVEDALEQFIPPFLACLARHVFTEGRTIAVVGRSAQDQAGFHSAVLSPDDAMMLDGDVTVIAKLTSSLPRDEINAVMTVAGLARDNIFSKHLVREFALRTLDMGHVNAEQEEQRINYERLLGMQFEFEMGAGPMTAPTQVENDYVPPGYRRMGDGSMMANPMHQPGPYEPLQQGPMVERQPGPRSAPSEREPLTGRGSDPTSNPQLLRRRASQSMDRSGAMMNLQPRSRRG